MGILSQSADRRERRYRRSPGLRLFLMLLALLVPLGKSGADPSREYQLKAAFLFNFSQFVEWPESSFSDSKAPFVIGVIGDDPFGPFLDQLVQGEHVRERPVVVRRFDKATDVSGCQILFVSRSEAARWEPIAEELKGRSVLTVADGNDLARDDGIIRFTMEAGKIRLIVNVEEARESDLRISSKLLRTAQIVNGSKG
jgi:hypothetical protein